MAFFDRLRPLDLGTTPGRHKLLDAKGWARNIVILFVSSIISFLLAVRFVSGSSVLIPVDVEKVSHGQVEQPTSSNLNLRLHPEEHVSRNVTTQTYKWRITSGVRSSDGVEKRVFLINNQFPGPTIEARSGDRLVVELGNGLDSDETAIHWHGLQMKDANEMDGAVGITQSPIKPGEIFIYNFTISPSEHGTFWYHAHDQVQRADGLYGGMVVHKPHSRTPRRKQQMSLPEQLLLVGDWYHRSAKDVLAKYMSSGSFGNEPVPDSLVVNGRGAYNCSKAVPARPVVCAVVERPSLQLASGITRLRVINTGSFAGIEVGLPGFSMKMITVDGGNGVEETATFDRIIWPGQRADFYVYPDSKSSADSSLQIEMNRQNFKYPNPALTTVHEFAIHEDPTTTDRPSRIEDLRVASTRSSVAAEVDETIVLYSNTLKLSHLANVPHGFINHTSWAPQNPPLISSEPSQWDKNQLVPHIPYNEKKPLWVDIVLNNLDEDSHPFHLHGYNFYVVASHTASFGWGSYNPYENKELPGGPLDLDNPPLRDTIYVPRRGYVILRFKADNLGIWMFHCHILWHQASGMAMALQVGD